MQSYREREREGEVAGRRQRQRSLGQEEATSQVLHPGLPHEQQKFKNLGLFFL